MGMLDSLRRRLQAYTGEDETPLDGGTPAWILSLIIHVGVLLALAVTGFGEIDLRRSPIAVIETPAEEEPEQIELPREVTLEEVPREETGSEGDDSLDLADAVAPVLAEESIVPISIDTLLPTETTVEPADLPVAAPQLVESLVIKGDVGIGEAGASGAVDRVTLEIAASLEQRETLVCWVFDQSVSLAGQRQEIAARLARIFEQLEMTAGGHTNELLNLVYAYGQNVTLVTPEPTPDPGAVAAAIESIPIDQSGLEMTFTAIAQAAMKAKQVRLTGSDRRNVMIVVFTDEVGNDQHHADKVAEFCRVQAMRVFVVGVPAPFGQAVVEMRFVEFEPQYADADQWAEVEQGPESFYPELVRVRPRNAPDEPIDSGFGPFSLSKLCAETNGIYFAVHPNRDARGRVNDRMTAPMASRLRYFFDPEVMREYRPDYLPRAQIERLVASNKAKQALVDAARESELHPMESPRMRFPKQDDGRLALLLSEAQKTAAVLEPKIDRLYGILEAGRAARERIPPEEKRWQAGYDLALGRILAVKVRTNAYNIMLAQAKSGMTFREPKSDTWILTPSDDVSQVGSQIERLAKQADELLRRVVAEHAGTPWAKLAADELKTPLGYTWTETYTGVNEPRPRNGGNGAPNRSDDKKTMLAPPKPKRPLTKI